MAGGIVTTGTVVVELPSVRNCHSVYLSSSFSGLVLSVVDVLSILLMCLTYCEMCSFVVGWRRLLGSELAL